ncbi:hypothetical protein KSP39_PZI007567 [Platanthera zijinensis]|uniref:Secreted protein n=1 Tax=Platanthera zijinensis TaxID=2320716 RepID=A0AAP0BNM1_9ASPA
MLTANHIFRFKLIYLLSSAVDCVPLLFSSHQFYNVQSIHEFSIMIQYNEIASRFLICKKFCEWPRLTGSRHLQVYTSPFQYIAPLSYLFGGFYKMQMFLYQLSLKFP